MELHERLTTTRAGDAPGDRRAVRRAEEPRPPDGDRRPRAAALQRRRWTRPRCASASSSDIRRHLADETGLSRDDRERLSERDRRRHPRLRPARAAPRRRHDHGDHGQRPVRHLDRAPGPPLRDDGPLQRRVAPAPDHQQDGRPGRPPHRRVVADGRRPPARRQPRQRDHPAAVARRARSSRSASSRRSGSTLDDMIQLGTLTPETVEFLAALRPGRAEHPHLGRYRLRQDDAAERALGGDPRRRTGSSRSRTRPSSSCTSAHVLRLEARPEEHRGRGRDRDPRARAQLAAHAARPDHRRRGPRRRGARHAPGDEHRPRRLAVDGPRQLAARRARTASRRWC